MNSPDPDYSKSRYVQNTPSFPHQVLYDQPLPKFRNSIKPIANVAKLSRNEDGVVVKDPQATVDEWNISLHIDIWIIHTRKVYPCIFTHTGIFIR